VSAALTATQSNITVNPAATMALRVAGFPSSTTAGLAGSFTVTALDAYNNTTPSYGGTVRFSSSDPYPAALPGNYTFIGADNGSHTFANGATFKTAGAQSLTATDAAAATISGTQANIAISPAAATSFRFAGLPAGVTAGVALTFTVSARDPYGNLATGYRGTLHFTSTDANAVVPADYTFTTTDGGSHSFSSGLTLKKAGAQKVTATDTVNAAVTGSATITVNPAAASAFLLTGLPSTSKRGTAVTFTLRVVDAFGNTVTGYTGAVHFTSTDKHAKLPADFTFSAADAGVHTFTVTFNSRGPQTITATDKASSSLTGSESTTVAAASVDELFRDDAGSEDDLIQRFDLLQVEPIIKVLAAALPGPVDQASRLDPLSVALTPAEPWAADEEKLPAVLRCAAVVAGLWLTVPQNKTRRVTSGTGYLARRVSEELS
jgi:hypothetical protein